MKEYLDAGDIKGASDFFYRTGVSADDKKPGLTIEQQTSLWHRFDSKTRTALKKAKDALAAPPVLKCLDEMVKTAQAEQKSVAKAKEMSGTAQLAQALTAWGASQLDGLINNAGTGVHAAFAETRPEDFDALVAVHLLSARATVTGGVVIDVTAINEADPHMWADYLARVSALGSWLWLSLSVLLGRPEPGRQLREAGAPLALSLVACRIAAVDTLPGSSCE